ncbi:10664_t:CDS:10 [Acaulospora morrowiae]|uniref:ribonuclease Z n=1 Tax=Acaulospora morrowiae TaxID=94023 RepID=A0A9N8ZYI5_9GLOM|nr:10664_t:CDS:10 [Acaulospora morrowiae]
MSVDTHEFQEDGMEFKDGNLLIQTILLNPEDSMSSPLSPQKLNLPSKRPREDDEYDPALKHKKEILSLMFNQSQRSTRSKESTPKKSKTCEDDSALDIPDEGLNEHATDNTISNLILSPKGGNENDINRRRRVLFPKRLPKSKPSETSVVYICKGPDYKGKFIPEKAKALGLKPGRQYADLVKGISVTAPDGTVIHPHQVIGPSRTGLIFIIIDVPSTSYIPSIFASPELAVYRSGNKELQPCVIIHMLGNGVLEDLRYQEWMKSFSPETEHVIMNEQYCPQRIIFHNTADSQFKLSKIDDKQFRIPYYSNKPLKKLELVSNIPNNSKIAEPLLIYHTEPSFKVDESNLIPVFDHNDQDSEIVKSLHSMNEYLNVAAQVQHEIAGLSPKLKKIPGENIAITTLGTGSTLPSKYRNVSSTLISIPDQGCILLDVGEGTFASLVRHLGPYGEIHGDQMGIENFLRHLKFIFISHMHADHHLGLIRVLSKWNELHCDDDNVSIHIIGPSRLWKWLNEFDDVQDFGLSKLKFIDGRDILFQRQQNGSPMILQDLKNCIGLKSVESVEAIHCPSSYGISVEHLDGWKIVYSGDTRPCDDLVRVGKNATLLIHEATFDNELIEEALNKKHSTTEEAVKIGERMNARSILLTHFSQRYPKVPVFTDDHGKVGIGFDFMQTTIGDLYKSPKYLKAIKLLYSEDNEEAEYE